MKTNKTELVFILDKSGSMSGLESDTIGGYNGLLKKQQGEPGEAVITTVLFDHRYEFLHDRINIEGVRPLTENDYFVEGTTALLDAIGNTINKIASVQRHTSEGERAEKVMVVIITDGFENASREYSYQKIKQMVELQKSEYGWEFIFLGANMDAISTAACLGINADRAATHHSDKRGTALNYKVVSDAISHHRANRPIDASWKSEIEKDYEERKYRGGFQNGAGFHMPISE